MAYNKRREKAPVTFPGLQPSGHWLLDVEVPVKGSTGNTYHVTLRSKGFTCTCTGFTMHGKCKHITGFWNKLGEEPTRYRAW